MQASRRSIATALSPLRLIDGLTRRTSFSYDLMPEEPIKLTVLKLDGSSFGIKVLKTATVMELKLAVEAAFSHRQKEVPGNISWPHVWGHFCLCYEEHKLLQETAFIADFGIKDGDQLRFMRHISSTSILENKQTRARVSSPRQQKMLSLKPKTPRIREKGVQEEDIELESVTKRQSNIIMTIVGNLVKYYSNSGYKGTKHSNSARDRRCVLNELTKKLSFKCFSKKDIWNTRLLSAKPIA